MSSIFVCSVADTSGLEKLVQTMDQVGGKVVDKAHHRTSVYGISRLKIVFGFLDAADRSLHSMTATCHNNPPNVHSILVGQADGILRMILGVSLPRSIIV